VLFIVLALAGCAVATGALPITPVAGAPSDGPSSSPQTGGPVADGNATLSARSVVGAGSFPRSFLIPGTDTSIRIGGD